MRRCALASPTTIDSALRTAVPADELAAFWDDRAKAFVRSDPEGWSAVCHRGAPLYFNRFIDWSQRRAVERLFRRVELQPGDPGADIGCGTGRWAKELAARGLTARGFDVSPAMVHRARELAPQISFDVAPATDLPLPTASQKVVTCITVLHHLSYEQQSSAAAELSRVLMPGGACIVITLLDTLPAGRWCYPRSRTGWEKLFLDHGLAPAMHVGEELLTPGLLIHWLAGAVVAMARGASSASHRGVGAGPGSGALAYRTIHRLGVLVSYPLEALGSRWWRGAPSMGLASLYNKELELDAANR